MKYIFFDRKTSGKFLSVEILKTPPLFLISFISIVLPESFNIG
jgi:hypothetical protein